MKNKLVFWFLTLILVACGSQEEEKTPVSLDDFLGETGQELDNEALEITDTIEVELTGAVNKFINSQLVGFDTSVITEFHPLDRFTFSQRQKIGFKSKTNVPYGKDKEVTPRAEFFYYTFQDTTKTKNAFYNWLDCFGGECDQVRLNENVEALKMPPLFAVIYDTVIVAVDYRCEDARFDWRPFQDSLLNQFGKKYNYQMRVGCGGPLTWK